MKITLRSRFVTAALLGLAGFLVPQTSIFAQNFHVDIVTTALTAGPFSIDFQLNGGATPNNSAVISNFTFGGGGGPFGTANHINGASGSLPGVITLSDSGFNEFYQSFVPGSILGFDVLLSQNVDAGPAQDSFSFALLDNLEFNIPTTGSASQLLAVDLPGNISSIQIFTGTGDYAGVTLTVTAIPEPSTYAAIVGAIVLAGVVIHRRRRVAKNTLA
jgi:hypothetical protein